MGSRPLTTLPVCASAQDWRPASSVPKDGTAVRLRDARKIFNCVMSFDPVAEKWIGLAFGPMGVIETHWDESFCPIHEWQPVN